MGGEGATQEKETDRSRSQRDRPAVGDDGRVSARTGQTLGGIGETSQGGGSVGSRTGTRGQRGGEVSGRDQANISMMLLRASARERDQS